MASGRRVVAVVFALCFVVGCSSSGESTPTFTEAERIVLASLRYDASPFASDASNSVADEPAARAFGQRLFFDTRLSGRLIEPDNDGNASTLGKRGEVGRVSCAGCHLPGSRFVDTRSPHQQISLAAQWTTRRTPTLLEVGAMPLYNWDGRRDSLWAQAIGVMESEREFNSGRLFVAEQIFRLHRVEFEAVFGALPPLDDATRFPQLAPEDAGCTLVPSATGASFVCRGRPGDGADYDHLGAVEQDLVTRVVVDAAKAIAAYVRQLRCGESRFDRWLDGDETALTPEEQRGLAIFVRADKGNCVSCHSGPQLSDGKFHNVGLSPAIVAVAFVDQDDRGQAGAIEALLADALNTRGPYSDGDRGVLPSADASVPLPQPQMEGAFRTPPLRCIAEQPSFLHTGQLRTLEQVITFFHRGGDRTGYPGMNELRPLLLDADERADLAAFLRALDGPGPAASLLAAPL